MKAQFTVYREGALAVLPGKKRGWRWRLRAANGNIVADSGEAYSTSSNALRAVRDLLKMLGYDSGSKSRRGWVDEVDNDLGIVIEVEKG